MVFRLFRFFKASQPNNINSSKLGHISLQSNQSLFYLDNVFPLRVGFWDFRHILNYREKSLLTNSIVEKLASRFSFKIENVYLRTKDGGAIVEVTPPEGISKSELDIDVRNYLNERNICPWFNPFRPIESYIVKGKPFLEDLHRFPSSELRVEMHDGDIPTEDLYCEFRKYGKIIDIMPKPIDSKDPQSFRTVSYMTIRSAAVAKNCLHDAIINGTRLRIKYIRKNRSHYIFNWIFGHPKVVLPLLAALLATFAVIIFDPVRIFFIEHKINQSKLSKNKIVLWIKANASNMLGNWSRSSNTFSIWDESSERVESLVSYVNETPQAFIVLIGPRGSGKRALADFTLKDRESILKIDCSKILSQSRDTQIINELASQTGYRPVFAWMNTLSSLLDLAVQGTIGQKAGFSESLENQFRNILKNTALAIEKICQKKSKELAKGQNEKNRYSIEEFPEKLPVVVLDNFLNGYDSRNEPLYDAIMSFAGMLVESRVAHVVLITEDTSFKKMIQRNQPDRQFNIVQLGDANLDESKAFITSHTQVESDIDGVSSSTLQQEDLNRVIQVVGGRLVDLNALVKRLKAGDSLSLALDELVHTSVVHISKTFLDSSTGKNDAWKPEQAWRIIKELADQDSLSFNHLLQEEIFSGDMSVFKALEQADLIEIQLVNGRPREIRPGKPIYKEAFRTLTQDASLSASMDIDTLKMQIKNESDKIRRAETELVELNEMTNHSSELRRRAIYLLRKIQSAQLEIENLEARKSKLLRSLKTL